MFNPPYLFVSFFTFLSYMEVVISSPLWLSLVFPGSEHLHDGSQRHHPTRVRHHASIHDTPLCPVTKTHHHRCCGRFNNTPPLVSSSPHLLQIYAPKRKNGPKGTTIVQSRRPKSRMMISTDNAFNKETSSKTPSLPATMEVNTIFIDIHVTLNPQLIGSELSRAVMACAAVRTPAGNQLPTPTPQCDIRWPREKPRMDLGGDQIHGCRRTVHHRRTCRLPWPWRRALPPHNQGTLPWSLRAISHFVHAPATPRCRHRVQTPSLLRRQGRRHCGLRQRQQRKGRHQWKGASNALGLAPWRLVGRRYGWVREEISEPLWVSERDASDMVQDR